MAITIAGQGDIRQRLNSDGLAALGLAGPLLSPAWTQALPAANVANFSFTVAAQWYARSLGMLITEPNPTGLRAVSPRRYALADHDRQCRSVSAHPPSTARRCGSNASWSAICRRPVRRRPTGRSGRSPP